MWYSSREFWINGFMVEGWEVVMDSLVAKIVPDDFGSNRTKSTWKYLDHFGLDWTLDQFDFLEIQPEMSVESWSS